MIKKLLEELQEVEEKELARALEQHGEFNSRLEGWAKILEESEEADDEVGYVGKAVEVLKGSVLHGELTETEERDMLEFLRMHALCGAAELIQTAAMATKYRRLIDEQQS